MKKKKFFAAILPNLLIGTALAVMTFAVLHVFNPMMGLLTGSYTVVLLLAFGVLAIVLSVYVYSEYRKNGK